ncbi:hypothetical protein QJS66_20020 [Kocuria rhizophila]|nr:hypothetical protein QJS66_20020 [Kocuria rhizophila]
MPEHELTDRIPADARYPVLDTQGRTVESAVKFSAAWLIDHAGFGKGFRLPGTRNELLNLAGRRCRGPGSSLSSKHALAMTDRGEAAREASRARSPVRCSAVWAGLGAPGTQPVLLGLSL